MTDVNVIHQISRTFVEKEYKYERKGNGTHGQLFKTLTKIQMTSAGRFMI